MDLSSLPSDQVASFIDTILSEKDPATVGLRRIVRKRTLERGDFPMRQPLVEEFAEEGKSTKVLSEDEKNIIQLEHKVKELCAEQKTQTENARQAVQNAFGKGFEEGSKKGHEAGKKEAEREYAKKIALVQERVASYMKKMEDEKRRIFSLSDRLLLKLTCEMVKKVVSIEASTRPEIILGVIKKALTYIADREKLLVRVSRDDIETVSGDKSFWAPITDRLKDIAIEPDDRIERGGCIIESNSGIVDARLGVQLHEIIGIVEKTWESEYGSKENAEAGTTG